MVGSDKKFLFARMIATKGWKGTENFSFISIAVNELLQGLAGRGSIKNS